LSCRYLIHSPYWASSDSDLQKVWAGMEAVKASGKARSIGVSSFQPDHLQAILKTAHVPPSNNQLEFHPYFTERDGKDYLSALREDAKNLTISAYGALAPITRNIPGPLDETLKEIAEKHGVNPDLVCLRWCIDQGVAAVTTSRNEERMKGYLKVFDFQLSDDEVKMIKESAKACLKDREQPVSRAVRYYQSLQQKEAP
jgi:diketogulonate reductase-like aldo/keto reductase